MNSQRLIDPEPFTIVVGVAGIIGGVASSVSLYKEFARPTPAGIHKKAASLLREARDHVRYVKLDIHILREIVREARMPADRRFRLGRRALLAPEQFERYGRTTDQLMGRLRKLLKLTHRLDRILPDLPQVDLEQATQTVVDVQQRIERILRDDHMNVDEAIEQLEGVASDVEAMITSVIKESGG